MSQPYASLSSGLLARKGQAAPSLEVRSGIAPAVPPDEPHPEHSATERRKRLTLTFSVEDYERLGIAAAKSECTRHDILRMAMEDYLSRLASRHGCACMREDANSRGDPVPRQASPR